MGIRIVHGNGDLIGAAAQGVSQGVENFQAGQQAQADRARAEQVATNLQEQLRMEQETHAAGMQEFNRRMLEEEAHKTWRKSVASIGPDQFDAELESLSQAGLSPELEAFERQRIATERQDFYVQQTAMGKRVAIQEMLMQNPEAAQSSPVLAPILDGTLDLASMSPQEIHETMQVAQQEVYAFQDQQRDLLASQQAGNYLNAIVSNPNTPFEMTESLPAFIRSAGLEDNPRALARFLAGLAGEAPLSAMYDGGPVEDALNKYSQFKKAERFAQTPEGRAALRAQAGADAANMGLGGGGEQAGNPKVPPAGGPRNFMEEVAARKQRAEALGGEIEALESGLSAGAWRYQSATKKKDVLDRFRAALADNPEAFQDEAAYTALMEKSGLDPSDPQAMEDAANAASMLDADFGKYLGQLEDGKEQRKADAAKVRALKEGGPAAPDLYRLVEEASRDATGEKWRALPPAAKEFKRFFKDPTAKPVPSALDAAVSGNPRMR